MIIVVLFWRFWSTLRRFEVKSDRRSAGQRSGHDEVQNTRGIFKDVDALPNLIRFQVDQCLY